MRKPHDRAANGKIQSTVALGTLEIPHYARVLRLPGYTVIPGFKDRIGYDSARLIASVRGYVGSR